MKFIDMLKGVFRKMISPTTVSEILHIHPTMSSTMKDAIELWESMYTNQSPWLNENVKSMNLASMIASEKARTATIEMEIKITGESERARFIKENFVKVTDTVRKNLEYGIALGSLVVKPYVVKGVDDKYTVNYSYANATNFYPLGFATDSSINEAGFVDRIYTKDTIYSKLEHHKLVGTTLYINTYAFSNSNKTGIGLNDDLGTPITLSSVPEWAEITPNVVIDNVDKMMFAYFKMPMANTIDLNSPLGVSGFAKATELIRHADEQYSNLLWEFEGGQLAIDVDRTAVNPLLDNKGNMKNPLPKLQDRLFRRNLDLGEDDTYNVFSPALRDSNIINGLNNILMHIEDLCDLSRGTLSEVTISEARTATELKILKQRSFAANADIQKALENTLQQVIEITDRYCDLYEITPSGDYEVAYKWDDSILVDKDAERQIDLLDVDKGLLSKVEYRMKWMGETEAQAEEALKKIEDQKLAEMESTMQVQMRNQPQNNDTSGDTEKSKANDKLNRANESVETTKNSGAGQDTK